MNRFARRLALGVLLSCGAFAAHADNTAQTLPFVQDWSNPALIAANDSWTGVAGIEGFRGDGLAGTTAVDPQTIVAPDSPGVIDVNANQTAPNTFSTGGVTEFDLADDVVALSGSGTARAPYIKVYLNTTGAAGINVAYNLRDVDGSADNSVQPVALQYRIGNSGNFTNVPAGFVADASSGPSLATLVTPVSAVLPADANNQPLVEVRIITTDAVGNDEWIGIDNISITATGTGTPTASIADLAAAEGNSGTTAFDFTVSLSAPAGAGGASVTYATADGTASAGSDYTATSGTLTIPQGASSGTVSVLVNGDATEEPNETFFVNLSGATGATLADAQAVGTITNDDNPAPPALSISDTAAVEGDTGTTQFMFTLSLSAPANAGGVTVNYATADGTATAGSDYAAVTAGSATIPAGSSSVVVSVDVNGDTTVEPNENFAVNVTSATGATVADGQGTGTINNDDVAITPIHDIQGNVQVSPLAGQSVTTRGIVTGRKSNGFFLQASDADVDADPATSEGIFVFTSAAPGTNVQIGNELIVAATVVEFIPAADPGQLPLTELSSPTITLVDIGNPLPAPIQLTTTFPSPSGPLDQLERVESMRVTAASFTVVAATGGNVSEPNATGSSNGQINLVVTGTPRPFREPGIQAPDPAPGGGSIPPIPRWDFNPELLFSDTDALGGPRYDLRVGTTLTNYVGPLDYGFRRYSVHQDPTVTPTFAQGFGPSAARLPTADEFTYASYNIERFFDTVNDPGTSEPVLTATAFANRLNKASLGIRDFLNTPDIVGIVEVENLSTLQALATKINDDAVAASQPNPQYVAYLIEGNDVGGIDVGFLVKTAQVSSGVARVQVVGSVTQLGAAVTWNDPVNGPGTLLNDRPPLVMDAIVHFANGRQFPITVIQVHQRSLNGATTDDADGARTRTKRQLQADYLADQLQAMQAANPQRRITVGGDYNAFEFNDGLGDSMGTVTGLPSPDNATAVAGDGTDRVNPDLLNLYVEEPTDQRYSFEFDGNAQSLDHILINQALGTAASGYDLDHARINADFPEADRSNPNSASRLADHDPAMAYFGVASADLAVTATASPATVAVGATMTFGATVTNNGPDAAAFPGVGFAFDAALPGLAVTAPSGWTCDAPTVGATTTLVSCARSSLANGGTVTFSLTASAPASEAGNAIVMAVSVAADTFDPVTTNDSASASININPSADVRLNIMNPVRVYEGGQIVSYSYGVVINNVGPSEAQSIVMRLNTGRVPDVSFFYVGSWTCVSDSQPTGDLLCTLPNPLQVGATGTASIFLGIPRERHKAGYRITASVSSSTPDPVAANNSAARRLGMPQL